MPAGTITLTSGSTAVTGTGTNFATELKVNDLMFAVVGGVTYTLGVQAIGSATALTLTTAFNGPTSSGLAWTALPNAALVGITAQVAADVAKAIRGFNFDKVNWQKIFSSDTSVTVTLPDLTKFIGPSWGYLSTQLSNSLTKDGNLGGLADKVTARENLGLGDSSTKNVGTDADSVMAGDAGLLKSGGTMTGGITMAGNTGIDLSGSNISRINVMSWISTAAARASLAAAGFSQPSSTVFDLPGASRTMRVICATAVVTLNAGSTGTITYPNAFPNACNAVVACNGDRNTTGGNVNIIGTSALGGFNFIAENSASSGVRINYIAVGY